MSEYSFSSVKSLINQIKSSAEWKDFKKQQSLDDTLSFMHELTHWYINQHYVWRLIDIKLYNGVCEKEKYEKINALRLLIQPISEGICLYAQYDYFPSRQYVNDFQPTLFDNLIECVISEKYAHVNYSDLSADDLLSKGANFLLANRLSKRCIEKKIELLKTPFFISEPHISGYLLIKNIISKIKKEYFFNLSDGWLIDVFCRYFFADSVLFNAVDNEDLGTAQFIDLVANRISELISNQACETFVLDTAGRYRSAFFKGESCRINPDPKMDERYNDLYIGSLEVRITDDLTAFNMLASINFVQFFQYPVTICPDDEGSYTILDNNNNILRIIERNTPKSSLRANRSWVKYPNDSVKGRLIESLFMFRDTIYHAFFIDHTDGLLILEHNCDDYNLGYPELCFYLRNSYKIDAYKKSLLKSVRKQTQMNNYTYAIDQALEGIYNNYLKNELADMFAGVKINSFTNITAVITGESDLCNYIAFSVASNIYSGVFEDTLSLCTHLLQSKNISFDCRCIECYIADKHILLRFLSDSQTDDIDDECDEGQIVIARI